MEQIKQLQLICCLAFLPVTKSHPKIAIGGVMKCPLSLHFNSSIPIITVHGYIYNPSSTQGFSPIPSVSSLDAQLIDEIDGGFT